MNVWLVVGWVAGMPVAAWTVVRMTVDGTDDNLYSDELVGVGFAALVWPFFALLGGIIGVVWLIGYLGAAIGKVRP